MMTQMVATRAREFGHLGARLLALLDTQPGLATTYGALDFTQQLVHLQGDVGGLTRQHRLFPAAVSLLLATFPVQLRDDGDLAMILADHAYNTPRYTLSPPDVVFSHPRVPETIGCLPGQPNHRRSRRILNMCIASSEVCDAAFPVKAHAAAHEKPLLHVRGLLKGLRKSKGVGAAASLVARAAGRLSADQLIGLVLYSHALEPHFGRRAQDYAWWALTQPDNAKGLSNALKALGLNCTAWGAALVEGNTLQGRGVAPVNLNDEIRYRTHPDLVRAKVIEPDEQTLRASIRHIIRTELPADVALPSLTSFWSSRWLWCVNGSSTSSSESALGLDPRRFNDTHDRVYRRMTAESLVDEPITSWDGTTTVSASVKPENGKSRAIFACDTRSYFAFSWILNDVQKRWGNHRVLLDPGKGGMAGIDRRIRRSMGVGGVNIMLDYDDFNSHHSTLSMQIVFDELCRHYAAPDWYRDVLISSFEKMYITGNGGGMHVEGTLMSGHRGTTFINSVLNAAYLRSAVGPSYFDSMVSLHTGDDVYMRANTLADCAHILERAKVYGCRLNPTKQSIGFRRAEFLRMGIGDRASYGYLARSVASLASGNWFNPNPLTPWEAFNSLVTSARSIINRAGGKLAIGALIAPGVRHARSISVRTMIEIIDGRQAIEGAPVYNVDFRLRTFDVVQPKLNAVPVIPGWQTHATEAYLLDHTSPVEARALDMAGAETRTMMVASSFGKGLDRRALNSSPPIFELRKKPVRSALGFTDVATLLTTVPRVGCLSGYPLINLIAGRLRNDDLRELVLLAGGDAGARDIRVEAFGADCLTRNIIGTLPFADSSNLGKRTQSDNIYVLVPIMM